MNFYIIGGYLQVEKKVFIRDMLTPKSILKTLLNYDWDQEEKIRYLTIDRLNDPNNVRILFDTGASIPVGEDYRNLVFDLKEKYREKVKGELVLMSDIPYSEVSALRLDMGENSGKVVIK